MKRMARAGLGILCTALVGCSGSSGGTPTPRTTTSPGTAASAASAAINPAEFTDRIDNPWYPLPPGARWVYAGYEDGEHNRDVVVVTHRTKVIAGVRCVAVRDDVIVNGHVSEHTIDYFAQHRDGSVWYFGEDTGELRPNGKLKTNKGTWHAGEHGALPGVIMPAHPEVGQSYAQEGYPGHAEDHARIVAVTATVHSPAANSHRTVVTTEWSPLEPKAREHKYYVRGVGLVKSVAFRGPTETDILSSYRIP
jgi:hypothetical protein